MRRRLLDRDGGPPLGILEWFRPDEHDRDRMIETARRALRQA